MVNDLIMLRGVRWPLFNWFIGVHDDNSMPRNKWDITISHDTNPPDIVCNLLSRAFVVPKMEKKKKGFDDGMVVSLFQLNIEQARERHLLTLRKMESPCGGHFIRMEPNRSTGAFGLNAPDLSFRAPSSLVEKVSVYPARDWITAILGTMLPNLEKFHRGVSY